MENAGQSRLRDGDVFLTLLPQPIDGTLGMLVGPLFVIGVVQQTGNGPLFGVGANTAILARRRPHDDLYGSGMLEQGVGLGPVVELGLCLFVGESHDSFDLWGLLPL